jgi:hypothetical protein
LGLKEIFNKIYSRLTKLSVFDIFQIISIVVAIICIILYYVFSRVGFTIIDQTSLILYLLVSMSVFIISNSKKNEIVFNEQKEDNKRISEDLNKVYGDLTSIKNGTITIENMDNKIIKVSEDVCILKKGTTISTLSDQQSFYHKLADVATKATTRVWLTHLDQWAPDSHKYAGLDKKEYFDKILEYAKNHPKVDFKRIISIPTEDKLIWVKDLIEKTKDYENLNFAYIRLDDLENLFPLSVVSTQIMDDNKMFLLNPELNLVPRTKGLFKDCLYFENTDMVAVYSHYYESVWKKITEKNSQWGCLIKDGNGVDTYNDNIQIIIDDLNKMENRQHKLDVNDFLINDDTTKKSIIEDNKSPNIIMTGKKPKIDT